MKNLVGALLASSLFAFSGLHALAQEKPEQPLGEGTVTEPIQPPENNNAIIESGEHIDRLFEKLRRDTKPKSASATAGMIWREWSYSGSKSIDLLMSWATTAMKSRNYAQAQDLLDQVVVLAPEYAEGWNRRATLYYTMSDLSRSIADIEKTLALEPRHFGALSGLAAIMQRFERDTEALQTWYKVLEIYPANEAAQKAVITLEEKLAGRRT